MTAEEEEHQQQQHTNTNVAAAAAADSVADEKYNNDDVDNLKNPQEDDFAVQMLPGPEPTEEDLLTLHKVADKLPLATWLVALVELCERFTYYGIVGPFQNYMQLERHGANRKGGLGLGQSSATALNYFFQFWCYITPIPGAIVSDLWLGKYKTIFLFAIIYVCGSLILFVTSLPKPLATGNTGMGGLVTAMVVIGIGTGGIKSNVSPMIAEQYTITKPYVREKKNGKREIVDPNITVQSVFMIFYMCINFGSLSQIATTELEHNVDFWAAYLLPFCFFFVGILALILGKNIYVKRPPQGSVIPDAFRICYIAIKNNFSLSAAKPSVRREKGEDEPEWSDLFVDEVRRALIGCRVFVFYPFFWLVYGQMQNNFVSQAGQMNTHAIPNDIMQSINSIAIIIIIPIVNKFLFPFLRRVGIPFRPISRIFVGFMCSTLAMAYAAIIQHLIYTSGPCYEQVLSTDCKASGGEAVPNDIHVAIQAPVYVFVSLSEIFASITGLEYAYTKAPSNMKAFIMAIFLFTNAFGAVLGIAISPTAKDPKILWMYVALAVVAFIAGVSFYFIYRGLNEREEELNVIDAEYTAELNANLKQQNAEKRENNAVV